MQPCTLFFIKYIVYIILTGIVWAVADMVCGHVTGTPVFILIIRALICVILPNAAFAVFYHRTWELEVLKEKAGIIIKRGKKDEEA